MPLSAARNDRNQQDTKSLLQSLAAVHINQRKTLSLPPRFSGRSINAAVSIADTIESPIDAALRQSRIGHEIRRQFSALDCAVYWAFLLQVTAFFAISRLGSKLGWAGQSRERPINDRKPTGPDGHITQRIGKSGFRNRRLDLIADRGRCCEMKFQYRVSTFCMHL